MPLIFAVLAALAATAASPRPGQAQSLTFEEYTPRSALVVPENPRTAARFPFIDVHSHHNAADMTPEAVDRLVAEMDRLNLAVLVNLSGRSGETLEQGIANMKGRYPDRFVFFANLRFQRIDDPDWGERAAAQLERDVAAGAQGLKIFKNLGMDLRDGAGQRIPVDDARFDPVWRRAGELGIPVLIHTADPAPFWEPHDRHNERWLELTEIPRRIRPPDRYPPWETIIAEQHAVFRRHPGTTFINAHLGWMGNDLARLGRLLDELPNVYTEIGAVLAELGRQPRFARDWLIRYQDRVLFGKDAWAPVEYHVYFRTLETDDDYFEYYRRRHAFWRIYGLDLPEDVLRKLYHENALRIIPGIGRTAFTTLGGAGVERAAPAAGPRDVVELTAGAAQVRPSGEVTVLVVRHAERAVGEGDDALSPAGEQRARALADVAADAGIGAIYTTRFRRTRSTAAPLAERLGVPIAVFDEEAAGAEQQATALARHVLAHHAGETVLVVGHSNTVPAIVAALGGGDVGEIARHMHDDLFIVRVAPAGDATVVRARYGGHSPRDEPH